MRDGSGRKGRECEDSKKHSSHILKVKLRDSSVVFNAKDEKTKQTNKTRSKSGVWPKKKRWKVCQHLRRWERIWELESGLGCGQL